jgi:hypothetical protein
MRARRASPTALVMVIAVLGWAACAGSGSRSGDAGMAGWGGTVVTVAATGGSPGSGGTPPTTACCSTFSTPIVAGTIASSELDEISGLVASRVHPGVLYAHVDSGGGPVAYAMSTAGEMLGTFTLSGVKADDWEDIAVGPGPGAGTFLYLGDIGDNAARTGDGTPRSEISVYRIAEPSVDVGAPVGSRAVSDHARLRFIYPDGPHDCETLMVDPVTGDLLVVSKEEKSPPRVYRAAGSTPADTPTVLELVGALALPGPAAASGLVTAGDISPSGDRIMIRNHSTIFLWCRADTWGATFALAPVALPAAAEPQGEALTFSFDGQGWYSASETSRTLFGASGSCSP